MKKYLISIESTDSERLNNFYAQPTFHKYKDNFKQFGIVGKNLTVSEYFEQGVAGKIKVMTPGELGCSLSHLHALRDFLETDEEHAIIFEDDAIERFELDLDELEEKIKLLKLENCFFLSLGGIQMKICNRVRGQLLPQQLYDQKVLKVDHDFLENLAYAYAYIVDRKMAEMLIAYHQPPRIYDHWQDLILMGRNFSFYATFIFEHPIIEQNIALSYLEQERQAAQKVDQVNQKSLTYLRKKLKKFILQGY